MALPSASAESYFYTPSLKGLVQQLTHLAFFGDGISVVSGARGSGKTALAGELVSHLDQAHEIVSLSLESDLELAECIEEVSLALGLVKREESLSVGEMLAELRHYVQALAQDKKLVVLLIDDAHHLDDQAIGALVSLLQGRTDTNVGLHLILLSEPGLDRRIDALQILDVPVYDFEIPNLSPSELANFLSRDESLSETLNSSKVQKLWVNSQGLPGSALHFLQSQKQTEQSAATVKPSAAGLPLGHIIAIAVLVSVLGWSLFMRQEQEAETSPVAAPAPAADKSQTVADDKVPDPSGNALVVTGVIDTPFSTQDIADEVTPSAGAAVETNDEPGSEAASAALATHEAETNARASRLPSIEKKIVVPDSFEPAVESTAAPEPAEIVEENLAALTASEAFIMAQNPQFYTLQVIAASKKASLEAYIARQSNRQSLKMYRGTREGRSWFVVIQGVYSTREIASKALKYLPEEQAKAGPWPRKFSAVQQEIEAFRRK